MKHNLPTENQRQSMAWLALRIATGMVADEPGKFVPVPERTQAALELDRNMVEYAENLGMDLALEAKERVGPGWIN